MGLDFTNCLGKVLGTGSTVCLAIAIPIHSFLIWNLCPTIREPGHSTVKICRVPPWLLVKFSRGAKTPAKCQNLDLQLLARRTEALVQQDCDFLVILMLIYTSSTAQGGGGSFKNRKPIGEVGCCESRMPERSHWWTDRWLRSPLFLSLSPSFSLFLSLSFSFSDNLPTYLPIYLYFYIYRSIYLSIFLSYPTYPILSILSIYLSVYLSTYLSIYPSIYLSIYLSTFLSIYLSVNFSTNHICCCFLFLFAKSYPEYQGCYTGCSYPSDEIPNLLDASSDRCRQIPASEKENQYKVRHSVSLCAFIFNKKGFVCMLFLVVLYMGFYLVCI